MAGKQNELLQELKNFEKEALADRREAQELRKDGVGLLTPALLRQNIRKETGLVLAYGRKGKTVEFSLDDLKRFVEANAQAQKNFRQAVRGVPLAQLERSSDKKDIERSRNVKSARLFRINKNLLSFRVTGNIKSFYLVRVRLEDWNLAIHSTLNPFISARMAATGRLSFDCACGRHQYWYRYLTNIGGFDVNPPKEQDFPKIRNPGLTGCCCKHVLKVLRVLKSNTIHAILAREIERQSATIGFADTVKTRFLTTDELRQTANVQGVTRNPREATEALRRFEREARQFIQDESKKEKVREMQKKLKPRNAPNSTSANAQKLPPAMRVGLIEKLKNVRIANKASKNVGLIYNINDALTVIAEKYKKYGITVKELKNIMRQENI